MAQGPDRRCPSGQTTMKLGKRWGGGRVGSSTPGKGDPLRPTPTWLRKPFLTLGKEGSSSLRPIPAVGLMCWRECLGVQNVPHPTWEKGDPKGGPGLRFCSWY